MLLRRLRWMLDEVVVCTTGDPTRLPDAPLPAGYSLRTLDALDLADARAWLAVHNAAFQRAWGLADYRRAILDHPHYDVQGIFLVEHEGRPVAAAAYCLYRRNRTVGCGHYGAVVMAHRRRGLGRALSVLRYRKLRELGATRVEAETTIGRRPSLLVQFGLGMRPKVRLDDWNTPDAAVPLARRMANVRLERLYRGFLTTGETRSGVAWDQDVHPRSAVEPVGEALRGPFVTPELAPGVRRVRD
jgi:hypothetical protein